jgi:catechol 2,3-dioxygenase-like lactoylglutathione lyase family enzyme
VEFLRVVLQAPAEKLRETVDFYRRTLGLEEIEASAVRVRGTDLVFEPAVGAPFYHFAFLVPGDRFAAAREWISDRVQLLDGGDVDGVVFDFDNWRALALYFHDPAGNVVELIGHRGFAENGGTGPFSSSELGGISEIGPVGDTTDLAHGLEEIGIEMWDGVLEPGRLAFFGGRGRVFVVAAEGRGWLPTGRPAEPHPVSATVTGRAPASGAVGVHQVAVFERSASCR